MWACRLCDKEYEADMTVVGAVYECPYCHLKVEVVPAPEGFYDNIFATIVFGDYDNYDEYYYE